MITEISHTRVLRSILITGASGGIGMALAAHYATSGCTLILWGRNPERLAEIATRCRACGAHVVTRELDLQNGQAALAAYADDDKAYTPDTVILGAGIADIQGTENLTEDPHKVFQLALVNYATPISLATAAAQAMVNRKGGRIALIGSVAGFYELPFAASYSSSKAGLAFFAKAARLAWQRYGVSVTLIAPGFVDTAMSQRLECPRPFLLSPRYAAKVIAHAIAQRQAECVFPWPFKVLNVLVCLLPKAVREYILLHLAVGQKEWKNEPHKEQDKSL